MAAGGDACAGQKAAMPAAMVAAAYSARFALTRSV
jgi:hypothetical protein